MLKKTITYEDYNGETRTEDFYFNLTRTELIEMEFSIDSKDSFSSTLQILVNEHDHAEIIRVVKQIVLKSYGEKSQDGRRFIKNQEIRDAFEQCPAFDILYMELATDSDAAAEFFTKLMPSSVSSELEGKTPEEIKAKLESLKKA